MPPLQYLVKQPEDQEIVEIVKANTIPGQQGMKGLDMERDLGQGITLKIKNGSKGMDMERDMVLDRRKRLINLTSQMGLKVKLIILPKDQDRMVDISQQRGLVMDKLEMGEMRVGMIKRGFRNTKYDFEDEKEGESDTKDSYESEITPKQLSQVTPGGGVLKIKLSKKQPIKITAGAPRAESDLAQTKVKTVHEPIDKENGQPPPSVNPNKGRSANIGNGWK